METPKTVLETKTIEAVTYSSTPYDDVYRTLLNDCPGLIIPVVNELFGKHHRTGEEIQILNNEYFLNRQNGKQLERITDSNFSIEGERYHIECQSTPDGTMLIRIFEYDTQIALTDAVLEEDILDVTFPHTAVLYLRHTRNTPQHMTVRIRVPGGTCSYQVPIMKVQRYSIDEIFEKQLYFLIPFYIFSYEHDLKEYDTKEEKLQELQAEYRGIMSRLEKLTAEGVINELIRQAIINMSQKVILHISKQYSNVTERLGRIMGGQILEYEAKDIFRRGIAEGMEKGSKQRLIDMICKKHAKGKTITQIADETEESEETICNLIEEYGLF